MSGLVLKKWHIDSHAENGDAIIIVGREGGLLAWILALMGIDPTTSIRVTRTGWNSPACRSPV